MRREFTENDKEALIARAASLKKPQKPMSFRKTFSLLYPMVQRAIDSGFTRKEVYEQLLTEEMRKRVALSTFLMYYHQVKRELRKTSGARGKRSGRKADGAISVVAPAKETCWDCAKRKMQSPLRNAGLIPDRH